MGSVPQMSELGPCLWVSMAGTAGVGKSTLAERLGATLHDRGVPTDVFGEEELFTRPEFTRVAEGFRTKVYAAADGFESAYRNWLRELPPTAMAIMDWNPAGMSGDLPWAADHDQYLAHLTAVRALGGGRVLLLHLQTSADCAVDRAARQRGEEWLARSDAVARSHGHDQPIRQARIIADAEQHILRTEAEVAVASAAGWPVRRIDASAPPDVVHSVALAAIEHHGRSSLGPGQV